MKIRRGRGVGLLSAISCREVSPWVFSAFVLLVMIFSLVSVPFSTLIIFNGLQESKATVLARVPSPEGRIVAFIVDEGDSENNTDDVDVFLYSLYLAPAEASPRFEGWPRYARWLGFEPARLVARGKYWRFPKGNAGRAVEWTSADRLTFHFCGGNLRHFASPVEAGYRDGRNLTIEVDIEFCADSGAPGGGRLLFGPPSHATPVQEFPNGRVF